MADDLPRPIYARRSVESARDLEDMAWKQAVLDLEGRFIRVVLRLGIWVAVVFFVQLTLIAMVGFLIWRTF